jgi:serine/threonine-protein kinase
MEDQHTNDPLIGTMFHDYRIEQQLAQGGMGAVYLCQHAALPHLRKVLKVVSAVDEPGDSASPSVRENAERTRAFLLERFEREALAVSQLQHRYIVPIDGFGTVGGRRCILMPFLEGKPLDRLLKDRGGRLPPHEVLHIAAQIARALDYAHQRGIVHRDLKPDNVFITPTDDDPLSVKVIDFGIAKQMTGQPSTEWRGPAGTLLFMAAEQFEHASSATPAADVYSLAVMIYLMTTGRHPWGDEGTWFAVYRRRMEEWPAPAPEMPVGWEEAIFSALSPDPLQRPQSMRELVYPLALLIDGGLGVLSAVARRWANTSPHDETLRGTAATSGAWRAAMSGAFPSASLGAFPTVTPATFPSATPTGFPSVSSGAFSNVSSGAFPSAFSGAFPSASSGAFPSASSGAFPMSSGPFPNVSSDAFPNAWPATAGAGPLRAWWMLTLVATAIAVIVGCIIFAAATLARRRLEATPPTPAPTANASAPRNQ